MQEIYISTDIEADGHIPGFSSMLSFASAAFLKDKTLIDTYSANLDTLPGAVQDPDVMAWWSKNDRNRKAWMACREDTQPPEVVMPEYAKWLDALPGKPIFIGFPASYDFMFVYWYLIRFNGKSPLTFAALDIKTYAMAMLKCDYKRSAKRNYPRHWFGKTPNTHIAIDDAIAQGELFCNILKENTSEKEDK